MSFQLRLLSPSTQNILNHKVLQLEFISGIGMWLVTHCWQIKKEIRPIVLENTTFEKINK